MAIKKDKKDLILNDLSDLQELKSEVKAQARQSAKDLQNWAKRIADLSQDFYGIAHDEYEVARDKAAKRIEQDPIRSVAAAFAAGWLLRALLKR